MYHFSENLYNAFTINKYDIFIMHIVYIVVLLLQCTIFIRVRIRVRD